MSKYTFVDKKGEHKEVVDGPREGDNASAIVLGVLEKGKLPDGLALQCATSYGARFIRKSGKNALGYHDTKNVLVVNGIADELKAAGQKGLIQPQKGKKYWAIRVGDWNKDDVAQFINRAARILGITPEKASGGEKKARGKKKKAEAAATAAAA